MSDRNLITKSLLDRSRIDTKMETLQQEVERLTKELKNAKQLLKQERVEHQQTKKALANSEGRLHAVVENCPIALWELDASSRFTLIKGSGLQWYGFDEGILGQSIFELCEGDRNIVENITMVLAGDRRNWIWEAGDLVYETKATPQTDEEGKIVGARVVCVDISNCSSSPAALQKAKEELEIKVEERTSALKESNDRLVEEIVKHQQVQQELQYRLDFEELIATLSTHFINLASTEIDGGIKAALEWIGNFSGVDRSYVFLFDETETYINNTHEWCRAGISPQIDKRQKIPLAVFGGWVGKIHELETIYIPLVAKLPRSERRIKTFLRSQSIKSLIVVPMFYSGGLIGFLGFDSVRSEKTWSEDIISLLRIMGEMFVNALERKRVEGALSESEKKYRNLVETSQDLIWSVDAEGRFTFVNQAVKRIYGYEPTETIDRYFQDFFYTKEKNSNLETLKFKQSIPTCFTDSRSNYQCETVHQRQDGSAVYLSFNAIALYDEDGNYQGATGTATDITEHKKSEAALKQAKDRLQAVLDAVPWYVSWVSSDLRYIGVNRQLADNFNLPPEAFIGKEIGFLKTSPNFSEVMREFLAGSQEQFSQEFETKVHGRVKNYLIVTQKYDEGKAAVSVGIDISDRKQAEAMQTQLIASLQDSERKFRSLYEATSDAVMLLDQEGFFFDCNRATLDMFCWATKEEFCGQHPLDFSPRFQPNNQDSESLLKAHIAAAIETGNSRFEWVYKRLDGGEFPAEVLLTAMELGKIFSSNNKQVIEGTKVLQAVVRDITERKRDEEQIKASLAEKEVLLKEIHHRVKNNLQVISSLLRLQSRYVLDEGLLEMLKESQNRVHSMALVHEHLYHSQALSRIDFAEYIRSLASNLFQAYQVNAKGVQLKIDVMPVFLNIDTVIPCGLIINELVSNSLKYAFSDRILGELKIEFAVESNNQFQLTVGDNGVGFPQDIDYQNSGSLGLRLVCSLVRQIQGNIKLDPGSGTIFKITFPG